MYVLFVFAFTGDDVMFGDSEHYKYLTNEADLNNMADDSIALTPKTPKRVSTIAICPHSITSNKKSSQNKATP